MRASGLSLEKFLASEHVSSSTYYYWKRKYAVEKHASPIENQTLIPVTISTPMFNKTIPHASELTVRFPNGIQVQVPDGMESSVIDVMKGNTTAADAILDRLVHTSVRFELTGNSMRQKRHEYNDEIK